MVDIISYDFDNMITLVTSGNGYLSDVLTIIVICQIFCLCFVFRYLQFACKIQFAFYLTHYGDNRYMWIRIIYSQSLCWWKLVCNTEGGVGWVLEVGVGVLGSSPVSCTHCVHACIIFLLIHFCVFISLQLYICIWIFIYIYMYLNIRNYFHYITKIHL